MIKVAFYKGEGNWFDKLIRWWTRSPYSHSELVIDDIWYSSSPRDGHVRATRIYAVPNHWDFIHIDCSEQAKRTITDAIDSQLGKPYDIIGILLSQVIPLGVDDPNSWFCSEICACALQKAGILPRAHKAAWFSPARLYNKLVQKYE